MKAGEKITLLVRRGDEQKTIACELGTRPGSRTARTEPAPEPREQPAQPPARRGAPTAQQPAPQQPAKPGVQRGYLGVYLDTTDDGIGILEVMKGSAAEKAGLKDGDRLLTVNGEPARDLAATTARIGGTGAGNVVLLRVQRGDQKMDFEVKLAAAPPAEAGEAQPAKAPQPEKARQPAEKQAPPKAVEPSQPGEPRSEPRRRPPQSQPQAKGAVRWLDNLERARAAAAEHQLPILIDFHADWCRPCKMLQESFQDPKVAAVLGRFVPVRIDVDKQSRLADEFEVGAIPHVVALASDGKKKLGAFTGYLPPADLVTRLQGWTEAGTGEKAPAVTDRPRDVRATDPARAEAERAQAERRQAEANRRARAQAAEREAAAQRQADATRAKAEGAKVEGARASDAELQQALKDLMRTQAELSKKLEELMRRLEKMEAGKGTGR
jgi:thioredoxin-like negative regulator of GroEL